MVAVCCPICEALLDLTQPVVGATVVCPDCGEEWHVAATDPVALVYAWEMDDEVAVEPDEDHPRESPA